MKSAKHEVVLCERCQEAFECKANNYTQCQCHSVQMSLNEMQYISECYDACLCASCLEALKLEYQQNI